MDLTNILFVRVLGNVVQNFRKNLFENIVFGKELI